MRTKFDIAEMRALDAVVARGGITRAARTLSLSQSAVSHKIRRLEESLGHPVLTRRPGAALLTEEGEVLHGYARRILALHDEAVARLASGPLGGRVRVGLTEDRVSADLSGVMGRFSRRYPDIELSIVVEQSVVLDAMLADGAIDVAVLRVFENEVRADDVRLGDDELLWIGPRDHDLSGLAVLPFVAFDERCFYRRWAMDRCASSSRPLRVRLECASVAGVIAAVEAGIGYVLVTSDRLVDTVDVVRAGLPDPPAVARVARTNAPPGEPVASALLDELTRTRSAR